MGIGFFIGLALIAGGGFIQGRTIVPMKYAPRCRWENVWLSLPYLRSCYRPSGLCFSVPLNPVVIVSCRFGAYPVECFPHWPGLGNWYDARGNWLHNAGDGPRSFDRLGLAASVGSLLPLLLLYLGRLGSGFSLVLYAAVAVMLMGLAISGKAGGLRQSIRSAEEIASKVDITAFGKENMRSGIIIVLPRDCYPAC
jgi:hypothetical protein